MRALLLPTLMRSSRLSEWLFSSEKISESSWNVRKLSLHTGDKGKSQQCCHGGVSSLGSLLLTPMTPVMLSSRWALLFGSYSKVFHTEG